MVFVKGTKPEPTTNLTHPHGSTARLESNLGHIGGMEVSTLCHLRSPDHSHERRKERRKDEGESTVKVTWKSFLTPSPDS